MLKEYGKIKKVYLEKSRRKSSLTEDKEKERKLQCIKVLREDSHYYWPEYFRPIS